MTDQELIVFARIRPQPEYFHEAKSAVLGILEPTREEPGCHQFNLHEGQDDGCLYLYEVWRSEDDLTEHYERPYTKAVFERYRTWLAEPVEVSRMSRLG